MNPLVIDCETTIFQNGHPFSARNKLCYVGVRNDSVDKLIPVEYREVPYGKSLEELQNIINNHSLLIAFNSKFDLHWLRRYHINFQHCNVWCLQLAEFIITGQEQRMPSLGSVGIRCMLGTKLVGVAEKYWDNKIDTPDIPEEELRDYLHQDCELEWKLYQWQMEYLKDKPKLYKLIWNNCQDLLVTEEMEWHGLKYDLELSRKIGDEYLDEIARLDSQLNDIYGRSDINWNSNDHLSCVLYGGTFSRDEQVPYDFHYKDGRHASKLHWVKTSTVFDRLVEPLQNTNCKKDNFFEVNEGVLRKLKATGIAKKIIDLMLKRNEIEKKVSTYFHGWPKIYDEMDWQDSIIHGQLNHCVAKTGRLSSSKPNQQNTDKELRKCLVSRFQ